MVVKYILGAIADYLSIRVKILLFCSSNYEIDCKLNKDEIYKTVFNHGLYDLDLIKLIYKLSNIKPSYNDIVFLAEICPSTIGHILEWYTSLFSIFSDIRDRLVLLAAETSSYDTVIRLEHYFYQGIFLYRDADLIFSHALKKPDNIVHLDRYTTFNNISRMSVLTCQILNSAVKYFNAENFKWLVDIFKIDTNMLYDLAFKYKNKDVLYIYEQNNRRRIGYITNIKILDWLANDKLGQEYILDNFWCHENIIAIEWSLKSGYTLNINKINKALWQFITKEILQCLYKYGQLDYNIKLFKYAVKRNKNYKTWYIKTFINEITNDLDKFSHKTVTLINSTRESNCVVQ